MLHIYLFFAYLSSLECNPPARRHLHGLLTAESSGPSINTESECEQIVLLALLLEGSGQVRNHNGVITVSFINMKENIKRPRARLLFHWVYLKEGAFGPWVADTSLPLSTVLS